VFDDEDDDAEGAGEWSYDSVPETGFNFDARPFGGDDVDVAAAPARPPVDDGGDKDASALALALTRGGPLEALVAALRGLPQGRVSLRVEGLTEASAARLTDVHWLPVRLRLRRRGRAAATHGRLASIEGVVSEFAAPTAGAPRIRVQNDELDLQTLGGLWHLGPGCFAVRLQAGRRGHRLALRASGPGGLSALVSGLPELCNFELWGFEAAWTEPAAPQDRPPAEPAGPLPSLSRFAMRYSSLMSVGRGFAALPAAMVAAGAMGTSLRALDLTGLRRLGPSRPWVEGRGIDAASFLDGEDAAVADEAVALADELLPALTSTPGLVSLSLAGSSFAGCAGALAVAAAVDKGGLTFLLELDLARVHPASPLRPRLYDAEDGARRGVSPEPLSDSRWLGGAWSGAEPPAWDVTIRRAGGPACLPGAALALARRIPRRLEWLRLTDQPSLGGLASELVAPRLTALDFRGSTLVDWTTNLLPGTPRLAKLGVPTGFDPADEAVLQKGTRARKGVTLFFSE